MQIKVAARSGYLKLMNHPHYKVKSTYQFVCVYNFSLSFSVESLCGRMLLRRELRDKFNPVKFGVHCGALHTTFQPHGPILKISLAV